MMKWDCTDIVKGALHWWALFSLWKHIYNDFCGSDINIDHFGILILILFKTVLQAIWKTPFTCIMGNVAPSVFGVERDWMFYSAAVILSILSLIHHFWVPQHYGSAIFIFCSTLRMETPQIYLKKKKRIKFLCQYCLGFFWHFFYCEILDSFVWQTSENQTYATCDKGSRVDTFVLKGTQA